MSDHPASRQFARLARLSLTVGLVGAGLCAVGWSLDRQQFFRSYLLGFLFWWQISVGCLGVAILYQLTGGRWGFAARPLFDAGVRTLPLVALLSIPLAFGLEHIYPWADYAWREAHPLGENRELWLSEPFLCGRAAAYLLVWLFWGWVLSRNTIRPDGAMKTADEQRLGGFSAGGLLLLVVTVSFAAVDWAMTLDPHYRSTMFGAIFVGGSALLGMAISVAGVALSRGQPSLPKDEPRQVLNDLGNLLLAFVMIWTYLTFSQYLITWSGNLPEEAKWYVERQEGGWQWVILLVAAFHFAFPFALLLSRELKRTPRSVAAVALLVLVMHFIYLYWVVVPAWHGSQFTLHWLDLAAPVAIGGLWIALFSWHARGRMQSFLRASTEAQPEHAGPGGDHDEGNDGGT